jgi:hypothetical protein
MTPPEAVELGSCASAPVLDHGWSADLRPRGDRISVPSASPDDDEFPDVLDPAAASGTFPVESAYMWVFAMGGVGAALLMVTAAPMPARTLVLAPQAE